MKPIACQCREKGVTLCLRWQTCPSCDTCQRWHVFRREMFKLKMHSEIEDSGVRELQVRILFLKECEPQQLYAADVQDVLQESLARMGDKTRRVFMLSRFAHKSNDEIAAELGIGVKGVEYHMTKALKRLRVDFKDFFPVVLQLAAV